MKKKNDKLEKLQPLNGNIEQINLYHIIYKRNVFLFSCKLSKYDLILKGKFYFLPSNYSANIILGLKLIISSY